MLQPSPILPFLLSGTSGEAGGGVWWGVGQRGMVGPFVLSPQTFRKSQHWLELWSCKSMRLCVCPHVQTLQRGKESKELLGFLLSCIRSECVVVLDLRGKRSVTDSATLLHFLCCTVRNYKKNNTWDKDTNNLLLSGIYFFMFWAKEQEVNENLWP